MEPLIEVLNLGTLDRMGIASKIRFKNSLKLSK